MMSAYAYDQAVFVKIALDMTSIIIRNLLFLVHLYALLQLSTLLMKRLVVFQKNCDGGYYENFLKFD